MGTPVCSDAGWPDRELEVMRRSEYFSLEWAFVYHKKRPDTLHGGKRSVGSHFLCGFSRTLVPVRVDPISGIGGIP